MEMILIQKSEFEAIIEDKLRYAILNYMPRPSTVQVQINESEYVTKKEAANLSKRSTSTIDSARRAGKLTPFRISDDKNGSVRFKRSEVIDWIEGKKI